METYPCFEARVQIARRVIAALFDDFESSVGAIVADGWPAPMARAGLAMHRQTWQVEALVDALERELSPLGGLLALEGFSATEDGRAQLTILRPREVLHLWPALPGAGLTPVLLGWLLGCKQRIRPSSRSTYFAQHLGQLWQRVGADIAILPEYDAPSPRWRQADVIVVSGRDDTVQVISEFVGHPRHRQPPVLMGYGHRVSAAVIIDDGSPQTLRLASSVAMDVVMWHQQGCFSCRGVIFCGSAPRAQRFAQALGEAIAQAEAALGATSLPGPELERRAQARGLAIFAGEVFGQGIGWAQLSDGPFTGEQVAPHVVSLHGIRGMDELEGAIQVPSGQLQGCALGSPGLGLVARGAWARALAQRGFTRICQPGQLQSPPAGWMHDGWPNVLDWLRVCAMDVE